MILLKRDISMNLSFISFYMFNGHIELWMTNMKSLDPIRQKHVVSTYFKKQDQFVLWSKHSIMKIFSTIMSVSLPINMTSKIEEHWWTYIERWVVNQETGERKTFVEKHIALKRVHPL